MSIFHETMRDILEDVQRFLNVTLQKELLTSACISHKESLLMKIHRLRAEYPQLHLQLIADVPVTTSSGDGNTGGNCSGAHTNPPPYIFMQGNTDADYVYSDTANVDEYEICEAAEVETQYRDSKVMSDEGDLSSDYKEHDIPHIAVYELTNVLKSGFLERKGKDRLGGWLNLFQKRFVALKDDVMYMYNKNSDKKPYCTLSLKGYDVRSSPCAVKDGNRKDACFELVGPGKKTYQFVAISNNDAKQWIEAVQTAIASVPQDNAIPAAAACASIGSDSVDVVAPITHDRACTGPTATITRDDIYEVVEDKTNGVQVADIEEELYEDATHETTSNTEGSAAAVGVNAVSVDANADKATLDRWYVGLWDCASNATDELEFSRGDLIQIVSKEFDDCRWWIGDLNGQVGLVPKEYLMRAYEATTITVT